MRFIQPRTCGFYWWAFYTEAAQFGKWLSVNGSGRGLAPRVDLAKSAKSCSMQSRQLQEAGFFYVERTRPTTAYGWRGTVAGKPSHC
ncbi:hypothetical protein ARMA_0708 [Ardenticatena maritima]|uniref:Uncharacterized protein n=1 Tax=Ardenticatena maritima TaxID=872965 RepID=A0A0M8K5R4_9CHLR|nr:hypothetical protein ARMA_0708 [Ardenticatena maritima]